MGFRTVVVLMNDLAHEWENDPALGKKIWHSSCTLSRNDAVRFQYGQVVEQVHGDTNSLALLEGYGGRVLTSSSWHQGQTCDQAEIELLRTLADKHGFTLAKKRAAKPLPVNVQQIIEAARAK